MNAHHHTPATTSQVPIALTGTWDVDLPHHIEQALKHTPALLRGIPGHHTYLVSDLAALYPVRDDADPASGDLFDAAVMYLLLGGADLAFDVGELDERIPAPVADWLYDHQYAERSAWLLMLGAEIRMHQAAIMLGQIPCPHSPASYMALRIIIEDAMVITDVLYNDGDGDLLEEFEQLGGNELYSNVFHLLGDLLLANPAVQDLFDPSGTLPAEASPLHPQNWFNSFDAAQNPWLERTT